MSRHARFRRRWAGAALAVGVVLTGTAVGYGAPAQAAAGCSVSYAITNQWSGGFGANVGITNLGDAISSWTLSWSFGAGQTITQLWNGSFTASGAQVSVKNADYNGTVPSGGSTSFGFNGAWTGSNPVPASFTLNGVACTGGVTPTDTPPVTPSVSPSVTPSVSPSVTPSVSPSVTPTTTSPATQQACDLYAAGGTPCGAAHSTTRALYGSYNGPLYQVQRNSDRQYKDIGLLAPGGYANAATQDSFCSGTSCTITKIYDQSANHNDLPISWGGLWKGPGPNGSDIGAVATALPLTVNGHKAYGIKNTMGTGYRVDNAKGVPTGAQPAGIYMVTSSNYTSQWCCFDYGMGDNSHKDVGNATMNAIYWGTACWFNNCVGSGPWVEADLENGMFHQGSGSNTNSANQGVHFPFVSAWEKNNGTTNFTLKYGNANSGGLTTPYSGALPRGYNPMKVGASLLLGTGGDNSVTGQGYFFEGAVTNGFPSDSTETAVQANIVAANYKF
jgi:non-reducing end alpha-L-arabinofuranosidase